jgi:hypothetical protein
MIDSIERQIKSKGSVKDFEDIMIKYSVFEKRKRYQFLKKLWGY